MLAPTNQPILAALSVLLLARTKSRSRFSFLGLRLVSINWLDTWLIEKEVMLLSYDGKINNLSTVAYHRCEVGKTLQGGDCDLSGKVGFEGLLLCERHARLIEAQDCIRLLKGIVSSLGLCLRSIPLRKHKDFSVLVRAQQAQATRELAQAYEDLRWATTFR
jgi:hypothetical protein